MLNTPLNYLPVPSLEKYLKEKLYDQVNQQLTQELDNYIFQKVGLRRILLDYKNYGPYKKNDANGKELFEDLAAELVSNGRSREDLIDIVIRFMRNNEAERINKIVSFLKKQL